MKYVILCLLLICTPAHSQTREVKPGELELDVTLETSAEEVFQGEMVLISIHGRYRRHITLEKLDTPELEGINWMQLGQDSWYETRERGQPIKNFRRRMALFPDRIGTLTIPSFVHQLTLTDEGDDWFQHEVSSPPVSITVKPAPAAEGWWFPVRQLEISDQWSNAPDQLKPGEGVLRVIRVVATGVSPDMIPPMPELVSPSAMIFAHPEKRFVELSPLGPVSIAFWRWTIRPTNDTSAIIEPIIFPYFDTMTRKSQQVTISAQRIAMEETDQMVATVQPPSARLHPGISLTAAVLAFGTGMVLLWPGRLTAAPHRLGALDPLNWALHRSARRGDLGALRRHAAALINRDGASHDLLRDFDNMVFGRAGPPADPRHFARGFVSRLQASRRAAKREDPGATAT